VKFHRRIELAKAKLDDFLAVAGHLLRPAVSRLPPEGRQEVLAVVLDFGRESEAAGARHLDNDALPVMCRQGGVFAALLAREAAQPIVTILAGVVGEVRIVRHF
jgi:hypothetical protein